MQFVWVIYMHANFFSMRKSIHLFVPVNVSWLLASDKHARIRCDMHCIELLNQTVATPLPFFCRLICVSLADFFCYQSSRVPGLSELAYRKQHAWSTCEVHAILHVLCCRHYRIPLLVICKTELEVILYSPTKYNGDGRLIHMIFKCIFLSYLGVVQNKKFIPCIVTDTFFRCPFIEWKMKRPVNFRETS